MKILLLTPQIPYPPHQGTALRNWGLLRGLATQHDVSLLTFAAPDQDPTPPTAIRDIVERVAVFPQPTRTMSQRLKSLLTDPQPDLLLRLENVAVRQQMQTWLEEFPFDWVQIEGLELTGYLDLVWDKKSPAPRVIFDDHNCEYLLQQRACRTDLRNPARWIGAAYSAIQWRRLRRHEANVCRRADLVVTVSQTDADALRGIVPDVQPLVIPNGITVAEYANLPATTFADAPITLTQPAFVFTGTMNFRPNVDGVLWFVHKVWPQIRQALPNAYFYIVGRHPHARLAALRDMPGIIITGTVPDTRPYINQAAVYVVPLLIGGGTRLKLLESTAMGQVVVSTSLGAEGFPDAADALTLADTPDAFATACIQLARDPAARQQHAAQALAFAQRYNWAVLWPRLLEKINP